MSNYCKVCKKAIRGLSPGQLFKRRDAKFCSVKCRVRHWRSERLRKAVGPEKWARYQKHKQSLLRAATGSQKRACKKRAK